MRPFTQGLRPVRSILSQTSSLTSRSPTSRLAPSQISQFHNTIQTPVRRPIRILRQNLYRHNSTSSGPLTQDPNNRTESEAEREAQNAERRKNEEAYKITFTCKPCGERSSHRMSKQGYHRGTVLIQCPSCKNRHVMSDHLGVFFDKGTTVEDLLKQKGQKLTYGRTDGDLEFWDDGTVKSFDLRGQELLGPSGKESS